MSDSSMSIGLSGLFAAQTALDVAGQNIANSSTPGYARREVQLSEATAAGGSNGLGMGVNANTVVREQLRRGTTTRLTPLLATIIRQGKAEGTFTISSPEHTAGVLVALLLGTNETASRLFLARQAGAISFDDVECTFAAYAEAFERVLGLPPGSWPKLDSQTMHFWFG